MKIEGLQSAAHIRIQSLGLEHTGGAMLLGGGFVGQTEATLAAILVDMIRQKNMAGPKVPMGGSEVYSSQVKEFVENFHRVIGLLIKENKEVSGLQILQQILNIIDS